MIFVSIFTFCYGILCLFTILLVLMQRGKGNMGLGNMGGSNQAIFGSSGGQDIFQKITWGCLIIILSGSLILALLRGKNSVNISRNHYSEQSNMPEDYSNQN